MARFTGNEGVVPTTAAPYVSGPQYAALHDHITGIVFSDVDGTLFIEQSADTVNFDYVHEIPVTADEGEAFQEIIYGPVYRIRFEPASDGTVFRLAARTSSAGSR